ncbi:hypothetical protein BH11PLA1_BH11PLA1_11830 [soil metagenome]
MLNAVAISSFFTISLSAHASSDAALRGLVRTGDTAPLNSGTSTFSTISRVVARGDNTVFVANTASGLRGIWESTSSTISLVALEGQATTALSGSFNVYGNNLGSSLSSRGSYVFFTTNLTGAAATSNEAILGSSNPSGGLTAYVQEGVTTAPSSAAGAKILFVDPPQATIPYANGNGHIAIRASDSAQSRIGIWTVGPSVIQNVAHVGNPAPGVTPVTAFSGLDSFAINVFDDVAFNGSYGSTTCLYLNSTRVASRNDLEPNEAGGTTTGTYFNLFTDPELNDLGTVVFQSNVINSSLPATDFGGVYQFQGSTLTRRVRAGATAPGSTKTFSTSFESLVLNNRDFLCFRNALNNFPNVPPYGIFLQMFGTVQNIAVEGSPLPLSLGVSGTWGMPGFPAMNEFGQVVFRANTLVVAYDPRYGYYNVIRSGQTVTFPGGGLVAAAATFNGGGHGTPMLLTESGRVVLRFDTNSSPDGIIEAQLPPPGCSPADVAYDDGTPLSQPSFTKTNSGINEGDYNAFFNGFYTGQIWTDIADDSGSAREPYGASGANNGVNEGDYNLFFNTFFNGCP